MSSPRTSRELVAWPEMRRSAIFSTDGRYRYRLSRRWGPGPCALFVCHNPSVAGKRSDPDDENTEIDDRTAVRMMTFAWFWGYDAVLVGNIAALVSTDPKGLRGAHDPVGPENDAHLLAMLDETDITIAGWGLTALARRALDVEQLLTARRDLYALALTDDGYPMHPLARGKRYIPDETYPTPFRLARSA